ncbi:MAG: hypothetical protein KGZ57_01870 [Dethiobacter sp.]|nr:hypothetical protein [Dethiobacter sp.]MCL5981176.1 hypothetical protein [Bacillota bacterium]
MEHAVWIYPWDLLDEGIPRVLDRLQSSNIGGINVAVNYHTGRFFLPHNPKRKLYYPEPGALYFEPDPAWYQKSKIKPPVSKLTSRDFLKQLREETARRGMKLTAWSLGLHNSFIGFNYPDTAAVNVFGDLDYTSLCPANEDVRKLFLDMYTDLSQNYEFDSILIESMEFMPFRHGYHHEVIGVPISDAEDFFLSLSFSPHLCQKAQAAGIDIDAIKKFVRRQLEDGFANPFAAKTKMSWSEIESAAGGQMKSFLELREELVGALIKDISQCITSYSLAKVAVLDFGPLYPLGPRNVSWQSGANLEVIAGCAAELHPTFYFNNLQVFRQKVDEYVGVLSKLPRSIDMIPAVRAVLPQVGSLDDLKSQVDYLKPHCKGMTFYNYGFMAYETLDWISESVS